MYWWVCELKKKAEEKVHKRKKSFAYRLTHLIPRHLQGICLALVVVFLMLVVGGVFRTSQYEKIKSDRSFVAFGSTLGSAFGTSCEVDKSIESILYSGNHRVTAFLTTNKELHCIDSNGIREKVGDNVAGYEVSFYGRVLVYTKLTEDGTYDFFSYNIIGGRTSLIAENVEPYSMAVSPDGRSILYVRIGDDTDGEESVPEGTDAEAENLSRNVMQYVEEKRTLVQCVEKTGNIEKPIYTEIAENAEPIAASDECKIIYYIKDSVLFMNDEPVCDDADYISSMYFNLGLNQVIFGKSGSTWTYGIGEKCMRVLNYDLNSVIVPECAMYESVNRNNVLPVSFVGTKSFVNSVFDIGEKLYVLRSLDGKVHRVTGYYKKVLISKDGRRILYITDDQRLMRVNDVYSSVKYEQICKIAVDDVWTDENIEIIYVKDTEGDLRYLRSNGKANSLNIRKEISDAVYCNKFDQLLFICDGTLYSIKEKPSSKYEIYSEDVVGFQTLPGGTVFFEVENSEDFLYLITGKNKARNLTK